MLTLQTKFDVRERVRQAKGQGLKTGFVPTMGALHAGHASLVDLARRQTEFVVVSIFVNPTQFAPGEDFERYPRPLDRDLDVCRNAGVDLVFAPSVQEVYEEKEATSIHVAGLSDGLCGPFRPGHFDGVATVVAKLFNIVRPDLAFFGEKDFQQLQIIRRMVRDLDMPTEVVGCPTIREPDGLAMSSRNAYLSSADRQQAASVFAGLRAGSQQARRGFNNAEKITQTARTIIQAAGPCTIEYLSLVDAETLQEIPELDRPARLCIAVRIGKTRLIDNIAIHPPAV